MIKERIHYTTQSAYDKIRAYFSKPGATIAYDVEIRACRYRTSDGRKCAVGCLVPDSLYTKSMENMPGWSAIEAAGLEDMFADVSHTFLNNAQSAHDHAMSVEDFLRMLDGIALDEGIEVSA